MGEEVKVERFIMETENGRGVVWPGIKSVTADFSEDPVNVEKIAIGPMECSFTATLKFPKFWRCKNRKRYKKLMMSCGLSRNYMDQYLKFTDSLRTIDSERIPNYQRLWDMNRILLYGF